MEHHPNTDRIFQGRPEENLRLARNRRPGQTPDFLNGERHVLDFLFCAEDALMRPLREIIRLSVDAHKRFSVAVYAFGLCVEGIVEAR